MAKTKASALPTRSAAFEYIGKRTVTKIYNKVSRALEIFNPSKLLTTCGVIEAKVFPSQFLAHATKIIL